MVLVFRVVFFVFFTGVDLVVPGVIARIVIALFSFVAVVCLVIEK